MSSIWYRIRRPFVAVPNFGCDWSEADEAGELVHRVDPTRGRVATAATNPLNSTPLAVNFDSHVTNHIARVGLNYKFDPTGAVYAPAAGSMSMLFKAPMLATWSWVGPYIGGTIGYSAGTSKTDTAFSDPVSGAELFATSRSRSLDGAIGGAQAGYNWLAGGVVLFSTAES